MVEFAYICHAHDGAMLHAFQTLKQAMDSWILSYSATDGDVAFGTDISRTTVVQDGHTIGYINRIWVMDKATHL